MELQYPKLQVTQEMAFLYNKDLINWLHNTYWEVAEAKNSVPYSVENHSQYQYTIAKLEGKRELLLELLNNFPE